MTKGKVTLRQLERLSAEGRKDELKAALTHCRFDDLRKFLNTLDVKVRSKQYAAYRSKEDHVELLIQVLEKRTTGEVEIEAEVPPQPEEVEEAEEDFACTEEDPELEQSQRRTVNGLGAFSDVGAATSSSKDTERVFLVQCINVTSDVLTNVASKKEQVPDLKRALTCELAYYVKRLKRIQDGEEE
ncbi:hypothetical protein PRIC1_002779 [Phytophthora ramorum]